jgi:hypothetical protein
MIAETGFRAGSSENEDERDLLADFAQTLDK